MKFLGAALLISASVLPAAWADLTIVQKVEGAGPVSEMTIRVKGDRVRVDATPQVSSIVDSKTGEVLTLMKDQKKFMRISGEKAKAMTQMAMKFGSENQTKPKLTPTGKKETINGHETEEYTCETPNFKARYWVATKYPDAAAILKELQSLNPEALGAQMQAVPDYRNFPGVPIKTVVSMGGQEMTTTVSSIKRDTIGAAEFSIPAGFSEMAMPAFLGGESPAVSPSP